MAKPYVCTNEVQGALAAQFVHGTDVALTLADASDFDAGGGYIRVQTTAGDHWALYEYTAVATNDLTGLTPCTLGVVETDAAYTFPIGSNVYRVCMGEDLTDLVSKTATAPAAGSISFPGIVNGETTLTTKTIAASLTELGYCDTVTSNIQTQLNARLPQTTAATNIYVDGVGGSDVTGTGSSALPYATIQKGVDWFKTNAPYIAHACEVRVSKGTYSLTAALDFAGLVVTGSLNIEACDTSDNLLYTAGLAGAGAASTITLASGTSWATDFWKDGYVAIRRGTGAGQLALITGSTDANPCVLTVSAPWGTQPDNTSYYTVAHALIQDGAGLDAASTITAINNVYVYGFRMDGFESYALAFTSCFGARAYYNIITPSSAGRGINMGSGTNGTISYNYIYAPSLGVVISGNSTVTVTSNAVVRLGAAGTGYGVQASGGGYVSMSSTATSKNYIQDYAIGVYALTAGVVANGTAQVFSGCTADCTPSAASDPAYIS